MDTYLSELRSLRSWEVYKNKPPGFDLVHWDTWWECIDPEELPTHVEEAIIRSDERLLLEEFRRRFSRCLIEQLQIVYSERLIVEESVLKNVVLEAKHPCEEFSIRMSHLRHCSVKSGSFFVGEFIGCHLYDCDLDFGRIRFSAINTTFENCTFRGRSTILLNMHGRVKFKNCTFIKCELNQETMDLAKDNGPLFERCFFVDCITSSFGWKFAREPGKSCRAIFTKNFSYFCKGDSKFRVFISKNWTFTNVFLITITSPLILLMILIALCSHIIEKMMDRFYAERSLGTTERHKAGDHD